MIGYLIRRVIQAVIVVIGVCLITFILYHLFPGGVNAEARVIIGPRATEPQIRHFLAVNGLLRPVWVQFGLLVEHVFTFNLGYSYKLNEPVSTVILQKLPKTVLLVGLATLITLIVAIPLGIFQVLRRNKPSDYALTTLTFIFYATPTFFLGIVLIQLFSIHWHIFPPEGPQAPTVGGILADWRGLVLPVFALAAVSMAGFTRYMRSSMMEALTEDYVRTARAKGLSTRRVNYIHALRNALIPIITLLGLTLPAIVSGALITEDVFNYPGMGLAFYNAAITNDFPLLIGTVVVAAVATVVGSLLADILYAVLDPRIRYV
ncbi:MAG: ABC transporter permease [Acidimicrobiales bacterium]